MGLFDKPRPAPNSARTAALAAAMAPPVARAARIPSAGMVAAARSLFQSADVSRLTGDWPTQPAPADWIISRHQRTLVARSREQACNNDFVKAYLRACRVNIVGSAGVALQSLAVTRAGETDQPARAAVEAAYREWSKRGNCDVTGSLSMRQIESMAVECAARDGEFMVRLVTGTDGGAFRFALQVLDPQRCPVDFDRADLPRGAYIRQGIEFNKYGRPLAYHFNVDAEQRDADCYAYGGRNLRRIPADEILHGFVPEFVGQRRGIPWLSTGLFRAKQASAMEDSAVVAARLGSAKMGFIQFKEGFGPDADELGGGNLTYDAEPGAFPLLPEGAEVKEWGGQFPSGELVPFAKHLLRAFAAGGGVSYPTLSQDLADVNFSSIRHGVLEEREFFKERQAWLIEQLCAPVFERWLPRALLTGMVKHKGKAITADNVDRLAAAEWQGRRWQWVDPRADQSAAESSKNNLLSSPSQLIREQGRDPSEVWRETAEDIQAMQAAGIPLSIIELSMGIKQAPKAPETGGKE